MVLLGHRWASPGFDLNTFTSQFFERVGDGSADPIIVIAAQLRGKKNEWAWVGERLAEIVEVGRTRATGRKIELLFEKNPLNSALVVETLRSYGFSNQNDAILGQDVARLLTGGTALCVRAMHQSQYRSALTRSNVVCNFDEHFVERVLSYNPNLVQSLGDIVKAHAALLYAFGGLKYLPPNFKKGFGGLLVQAETTAAVVARFKQAVQGARQRSRPR